MQKSEEDKIFTEYLRKNGLTMGDSEPYLETYEPLMKTSLEKEIITQALPFGAAVKKREI